jgi:hypothetical protein
MANSTGTAGILTAEGHGLSPKIFWELIVNKLLRIVHKIVIFNILSI